MGNNTTAWFVLGAATSHLQMRVAIRDAVSVVPDKPEILVFALKVLRWIAKHLSVDQMHF